MVTITEIINNVEYVIGGGWLGNGRGQKITFKPTINDVLVKIAGPYTYLELTKICTQYPKSVQHTYLVDVCDESKDRYRFGFNGMEKDNDIKGVGNSLDFGSRMYDSRIGKFLALDPLAKDFTSESNYSFAGNSPLIFVDKEGKKKTTYYYIYDQAKDELTVPKTGGDVTNGLHRQYYRDGNGRDRWIYYDYSEINLTIIQADGSELIIRTTPFNLEANQSLMIPFDWAAEVMAGEKEFPKFDESRKEGARGKTYGGVNWTTKNTHYRSESWFNKAGDPDAPSINIDDFLDAATAAAATNGGALGPENIKGLIRLSADAAQVTNAVYENAVGPNFKDSKELNGVKDEKSIKVCEGCKSVKQDGTPISSDSAKKVSTPQNTDTQSIQQFHE